MAPLLILVIILWDQFCRNWHLFSHSPPNSPTMSCSWHQPRSCVFYVKCSIMLNTLSYLWALFMMRRVNDLYSSFFFLCNVILSLSCTAPTKQQYPVSIHLCTTIKSFQSHVVTLHGLYIPYKTAASPPIGRNVLCNEQVRWWRMCVSFWQIGD